MASITMFGKGSVVEFTKSEYNEVPSDLSQVTDWVDISCIATNAQYSGATTEELDVSTLCSPAKEYAAGDTDAGTLTFDAHLVPNDSEMYQALLDATNDKKKRLWRVTYQNGSTWTCAGFITSRPWGIPNMAEIVTQTINVKCSGAAVEVLAAADTPNP